VRDAREFGFHTRAAQSHLDGKKVDRPLSVPIVQSTTHQVASSREMGTLFRNRADIIYTRFGNPTNTAAEEKIAALEGAEAGLIFGSGMGAIVTALLTVLKGGDHVVAQRDIFAQTFTFLDRVARPLGVETTFVDATRPDEVRGALRPNTKLIYIESPSNPLLKIVDIAAIADLARPRGLPLFIDSTFASPYLQNPISLGATLVLHSATKFLGGHSDIQCGAAAGPRDLVRRIYEMRAVLGTIQDPHNAWLLLRGMKTLGVRVQRQCETALRLAQFLQGQPGVRAVHYPWLETSPYHALARRQMRAAGGVLSFDVQGGLPAARAFLDALELIPIATSLGGVETLIEIPAELDFNEDEMGAEVAKTGLTPALIRLSVGLEDVDDLLGDLKRGLAALSP